VRHWFGWMMLAAGLPCWIMGLSMDRQVAAMLAKINASKAMPESMHQMTEWVKSTYWLAPYLLWIGGALVVVGSVLGIIGLLIADNGDNVDKSAVSDRHLNP
jgi:hypothetical protein